MLHSRAAARDRLGLGCLHPVQTPLLNIVAQVLNAFLMPLVIGFLVALAIKALPDPYRLRG